MQTISPNLNTLHYLVTHLFYSQDYCLDVNVAPDSQNEVKKDMYGVR